MLKWILNHTDIIVHFARWNWYPQNYSIYKLPPESYIMRLNADQTLQEKREHHLFWRRPVPTPNICTPQHGQQPRIYLDMRSPKIISLHVGDNVRFNTHSED